MSTLCTDISYCYKPSLNLWDLVHLVNMNCTIATPLLVTLHSFVPYQTLRETYVCCIYCKNNQRYYSNNMGEFLLPETGIKDLATIANTSTREYVQS